MATPLTDTFVMKRHGRQINIESAEGVIAETRMFPDEQIAKMAMTTLLDLGKKQLELAIVVGQGAMKK